MESQKWFAVSVVAAKKIEGGITMQSKPVALQANSAAEAVGYCVLKAREEWFPVSDGWYDHQAQAVEIPVT
jgi:hypothetical protein